MSFTNMQGKALCAQFDWFRLLGQTLKKLSALNVKNVETFK